MIKKILLIIPCYNCQTQILRVLSEIDSSPSITDSLAQILIIENCSTDNTLSTATNYITNSEYRNKYLLIQNYKNVGLGGSQITGLKYGIEHNFDTAIVLHGDNQAVYTDLREMLVAINQNPQLSAVLGARFLKSSRLNNYSRIRTLGNLGLNFIFSLVTGKKISDLGSGINVFNLQALQKINFAAFDQGFAWNIDLLLTFIAQRFSFVFLPITWNEKDQISNASNIKVGLKALKALFFWRFRSNHGLEQKDLIPSYRQVFPIQK